MTNNSKNAFASIRSSVNEHGIDSRVEVNQRALIDKILARYASANAVYRELIQNSNDAEATLAEIYFTTTSSNTDNNNNNELVSQVVYRNNGMPFRPQDWSRLQKIAEGNPDVSKVGAFGVGAYSMFSIAEEPMVVSGSQALCFLWKGDALWSKVAPHEQQQDGNNKWTSFVLPSRDLYALPDLVEFGQFLIANLTFTASLHHIRLFVNNELRLDISKHETQAPRVVEPPKSTGWWRNDGAQTLTPQGLFLLNVMHESKQEMVVKIYNSLTKNWQQSSIAARYVSATAKTNIPTHMAKRMQRVTKKDPPATVKAQVLLGRDELLKNNQSNNNNNKRSNMAMQITSSFVPHLGQGRIFIGFRTSQTTGLGAHVAAPLLPTVEREAIDLQDATLKIYNTELLQLCGIVLRLTLEHAMVSVGHDYVMHLKERQVEEQKLLKEYQEKQQQSVLNNNGNTKEQDKAASVDTNTTGDATTTQSSSSSSNTSGLLGFAKFMAKGVTKQIVQAFNTVVTAGHDDILHPPDLLPLSYEESQAVLLMQSFCPQQSTPDSMVGTALAQGFSACLSQTLPPVLTRTGVVQGNEARLPHLGLEYFLPERVVRRVVYENAQEYHEVLCQCRALSLDDLLQYFVNSKVVLERKDAIRLVKWWVKYLRQEPRFQHKSMALKNAISFWNDKDVDSFESYLYFVQDATLKTLPLPKTVLPKDLQDAIGTRVLSDSALRGWFIELPVDVFAQFITGHACIVNAQPEDEKMRLEALGVLCKEWQRKSMPDKIYFGNNVTELLKNKRCLPFDSSQPMPFAAERPNELYLNSAELKAFSGVSSGGTFLKVSQSLKDYGVTDDFLLMLGVRKSVAIDFLFANLDTLKWNDDPKPLIEYLRSATLSRDDLIKLKTTQYLPAENDASRSFGPTELYLPNSDLRVFPFIRLLQWPSDEEVAPKSGNGKFLTKLGAKTHPPLLDLLKHTSKNVTDDQIRIRCLDYIVKNLGPNGAYENDFRRVSSASLAGFAILPCIVKEVFSPAASQKRELQSPVDCYSDRDCLVMGFSVLDPDLDKKSGNLYGSRFRVAHEPGADLVLAQLMHLVATAQEKLAASKGSAHKKYCQQILKAFESIFGYLSQRSNSFDKSSLNSVKKHAIIPIAKNDTLEWIEPELVYFKNTSGGEDSLTETLFHVVDFSPFLASVGVKSEATTADLFRLMLTDAQKVLSTLGSEDKYRSLLRRIAANPPFRRVTPQIRQAPFLLAYKVTDSEEDDGKQKRSYLLAKASDIYLIDNSFFGRMFDVLRGPNESDLENFYATLGSDYISKRVDKRFDVVGRERNGTMLTKQLAERLEERRPLLVSPSVTSRPLVANASKILDAAHLKISEVDNLKAVYALNKSVRNQRITCCAKAAVGGKQILYVTNDFDWFDVGYAVGGLILARCQLEDAFFIGSILEAPLDQLRSRGFPVDKILIPPEPEPIPPPPPLEQVVPASARTSEGSKAEPTMAQIPSTSPTSKPSGSGDKEADRNGKSNGGVDDVLKQMFPDADESFIAKQLGKKATIDKVRGLAEQMAEKGYPKKKGQGKSGDCDDDATEASMDSFLPPDMLNPEKQKKFGKRIGRALNGIRNSAPNLPSGGRIRGAPPSGGMAGPATGGGVQDSTTPVSPAADSSSHANMEAMLKNTVKNSSKVNTRGISAPEQVMTQMPEGLNRKNDGCEVIPGHSLKPFNGPYRTGKSHNGITVFASRTQAAASDAFLTEHFHAVDCFADVLQNLCGVFQLQLSTVAIFHDPAGGTIAFNANRALHFNVRFFYSLHYGHSDKVRDCYSYWFTTTAHELAHHLVSAHNKEHGYYTESYVTLYLPKLVSLLTALQSSSSSNAQNGDNTPTQLRSKFGR